MTRIFVCGSFADLLSRQGSRVVRFLQEAARLGPLHGLVWPDAAGEEVLLAERVYYLAALRYVASVDVIGRLAGISPPPQTGDVLAIREHQDTPNLRTEARQAGLRLLRIEEKDLEGFPASPEPSTTAAQDKHVMVTGTFDWLHSGHVRFFEEVSGYGRLTVVVGHDDNIRLLKGAGHPLFGQAERLYRVQSIRYVQQAVLSTGHGWLDAEPELDRMKPDIYAVNEDGDKPEKRAYCEAHGIQYLVLKRAPKEGLTPRSSTELRGF